jgi:hypothetical protein
MVQELPGDEIQDKIYLIRGVQVMVDRDLARLYEVETGALKRAVKRNIERFPEDFMFELTNTERETLICQIGISKVENLDNLSKRQETLICQIGTSKVENLVGNPDARGGDRFSPFVFTEPGVAMLSSMLRSDRAIQVNIAIMRTFIQLRRQKDSQTESLQKFQNLENKLDEMSKRIERLEERPARNIDRKNQTGLTNANAALLGMVGTNVADQVTQIQSRVSEYFHLKMNDLRSQSRIREFVLARQIAIYLIREKLGLGFREIGKYFCGRDHATIIHSYKKVQLEIEKNIPVQEAVFSIQKVI